MISTLTTGTINLYHLHNSVEMLIVRFLLLVTLLSIAFAELRLQKQDSSVRVRKEWRQLSTSDRKKVASAFWKLKTISTEKGRKMYGPNFNNYDEITLLHACTVYDPRCDQGHFGPHFIT